MDEKPNRIFSKIKTQFSMGPRLYRDVNTRRRK